MNKQWESRIVDTGNEAPDQLLANPKNWRTHPEFQQRALEGVLDEVGWVQQVIVNKRTGNMIDGHLRVKLALRREEPFVPVVYVDLSEAEEDLILATFDPLTSAANADAQLLGSLLNELNTGNEGVQALLADIAAKENIDVDKVAFPELNSGDKGDLEQITFTMHKTQMEVVRAALGAAREAGNGDSDLNSNSNGNAIAYICQRYINADG